MPGQWPATIDFSPPRQRAPEGNRAPASWYTTFRELVPTFNLHNLLSLPGNIARRFFRPQRIRAEPVFREDGARKKRLIDMGAGDSYVTPTKSPQKTRLYASRHGRQSRNDSVITPTPNAFELPLPGKWPYPAAYSPDSASFDDSLMDEADSDNLYIGNTTIISDTSYIDPAINSNPSGLIDITLPRTSSPNGSTSVNDNASFYVNASFDPDASFHGNSSINSNASYKFKALDDANASFNDNTSDIYNSFDGNSIFSCSPDGSSTPYQYGGDIQKAPCDSLSPCGRKKRNAEPRAKETVVSKTDLWIKAAKGDSSLPLGPEYSNDLSELPDAPSPIKKKTVVFPGVVQTKPFFRDTLVAEMLDSTLSLIKDCPDPTSAKVQYKRSISEEPDYEYDLQAFLAQKSAQHDAAELAAELQKAASPSKAPASKASPPKSNRPATPVSPVQTDSSDNGSIGFHGVPPETWDDQEDSLEEASMSNELIHGLYEELEQKLMISPPQQPLLLPPAALPKPLVATLTKQEKQALDAAAVATDYGKVPLAPIVKGKLNAHDFSTLLPDMFNGDERAWLNDNIVNEYLAILVEDVKKREGYIHRKNGPAPTVHAFLSQWYTNMTVDKTRVKRWADRRQLGGKNLLDAQILLFPICDNQHWRLLVIKPQERLIEYYDSLNGDGTPYTKVALDYLQMELGPYYVATEWTVVSEQRSSRQKNSSDCGIFTVLNALVLLRGEEHNRVVSTWGMEDARFRVAATLMAGQSTSELD